MENQESNLNENNSSTAVIENTSTQQPSGVSEANPINQIFYLKFSIYIFF